MIETYSVNMIKTQQETSERETLIPLIEEKIDGIETLILQMTQFVECLKCEEWDTFNQSPLMCPHYNKENNTCDKD